MDTQLLWKKNIKKWGSELGFISIGFTKADTMDDLAPMVKARIDQGLATPFEDTEIQRRLDPRAVWPLCQTVVVLAYPLPSSLPPQKGEGVLARSAVGVDYHHVLNQKIKALMDTMIRNNWQGNFDFQVDTGPLIERGFAVRAGSGWIGRNQQLIIPNYGSFVMLAILLLDQTIPPDAALKAGQCGSCQKCLHACPAQIIGQEPFAAKRCISYLTQSKEMLTAEERGQLGTQIFGCDACQEVCPHNQKRMMEEQVFPTSLRRGVDLLETLNLTKEVFQQRFRATAAGWRGKGVLQRNAFVAMHNIKDDRRQQWLREREKDKSVPPIIIPYTRCDAQSTRQDERGNV
ncbi:tRNA epoxyqueuosine(34) reductase QueG [Desulfosporosinus burensis]